MFYKTEKTEKNWELFIQHARMGYPEANENLNDSNIECIEEASELGYWFVRSNDRDGLYLYPPDHQTKEVVYNFCYDSILPEYDGELYQLLKEGDIYGAFERMEFLGAFHMVWS